MSSSALVGTAIVKSVTGDTITVIGKASAPGQQPPEKELALNYVVAPRAGSGTRSDEDWSWEAREFMRKLLIGNVVSFKAQNTTVRRPWANVQIEGQNVAELLVAAGLARVRDQFKQQDANPTGELATLLAAEEKAAAAKLGLHSGTTYKPRKVIEMSSADICQNYKDKTLPGIVEWVKDGATLRIALQTGKNTYLPVLLSLSGLSCPGIKRVKVEKESSAEASDGKEERQEYQEIPAEYANEARFTTESLLLLRDVEVTIEGASQHGNLCGSVSHPKGNIAELLLKTGMGQIVSWSIGFVKNPSVYREAENVAKTGRKRLWKNYVPSVRPALAGFSGKVVEIVSAEVMVVQDAATGQRRRISLSSVRNPKPKIAAAPGVATVDGARSRLTEPFMWEAREFHRKKLLTKTVNVQIDFLRTREGDTEALPCCTVTVPDRDNANVAVDIIAAGLAEASRHKKEDEDRSPYLDDLNTAQNKAHDQGKGIWDTKAPAPAHHLNDLSRQSAANNSSFCKQLQSQGHLQGIVEYVFSGSKVKLFVQGHDCLIAFALEGVRTPKSARPAKEGVPAEAGEPYGAEALAFTSELFQHNCEFEVTGIDKAGTFIGHIYYGQKQNLAIRLLEQGLASVFAPSAAKSIWRDHMEDAEDAARDARLRIWENYVPAPEDEGPSGVEEAGGSVSNEALEVVVTELIDGSHFFIKDLADSVFEDSIAGYLATAKKAAALRTVTVDAIYAAPNAQGEWGRAQVLELTPQKDAAYVAFIDSGREAKVAVSALRPLPAESESIQPLAHECFLAYVLTDPLKSEFGASALAFLDACTSRKDITATVEYRDKSNRLYVTLHEPSIGNLNAALLRAGWGTVEARSEPYLKEQLDALTASMNDAHEKHRGRWVRGDPDADDPVPAVTVKPAKGQQGGRGR